MPARVPKISPFTAATAEVTPLPLYRFLSPSRRSTASCAPVDAPDGTAARPREPSSRRTSTSTVGLPRLSRISRAVMSVIAVMDAALGTGLDAQLLTMRARSCNDPFFGSFPARVGAVALQYRHIGRESCLG